MRCAKSVFLFSVLFVFSLLLMNSVFAVDSECIACLRSCALQSPYETFDMSDCAYACSNDPNAYDDCKAVYGEGIKFDPELPEGYNNCGSLNCEIYPHPCSSNADCPGQYCRVGTGDCVSCLNDLHCSQDYQVCENYQCRSYPWVSKYPYGENTANLLTYPTDTMEFAYKKSYVYPRGTFDSPIEYCCYNYVNPDVTDQAYADCVDYFYTILYDSFTLNLFFDNHADRDNGLAECIARGDVIKSNYYGFATFSDGRFGFFDGAMSSTFFFCLNPGCSGLPLDQCSLSPLCSPAYSSSEKLAYFRDSDGDGKGDPLYTVFESTSYPGYVTDFSDCNDNNASIYFGANEICGDGKDNNCDGLIDENCATLPFCGDGTCNNGETYWTCQQDCPTNPCSAMSWLTNPQVGDKGCKPLSGGEIISTCTSTGVTETTCGTNETCEDTDGLNAYCRSTSISQCGSCETGSCATGLSCRTTLTGQKICVPNGNCAIAVGSPECTYTSTSTCVSTTKYTCESSTGVWDSGTTNSVDCGYTGSPSFIAYWAKLSSPTQMLSSVYVGETVYRFFRDTAGIFTGTVEFSGAGGSATLQMTNGALINSLGFNSITLGSHTFTATTSAGSDSSTLTAINSTCRNGDIEPGEVCDNRTSNGIVCTAPYGGSCVYCSSNCQQIITVTGMYCGDGSCNPEFGEGCSCSDCSSLPSCQQPPEGGTCDDGIKQSTEECDAGTNNGVPCSAQRGETCTYCSESCTNLISYGTNCSDGIQNGNELGIDCGDNDLCTGDKEFCSSEETQPSICSDYSTQETCENFTQSVADASVSLGPNERAKCVWDGADCNAERISIAPDGSKIGSCTYIQNENEDTCDDGYLTYSWNGSWTWDVNNEYPANSTMPFCEEGYLFGGEFCHYDPLGSWASCKNGQRIIPCPAQVQLNYFTWKNIVAAIFLIIAIYLIINNLRNLKKESVQEIKKEKTIAKKKPAKNKSPAKKTTKKKVVGNKKVVKKK